jgi:hypothetical protein
LYWCDEPFTKYHGKSCHRQQHQGPENVFEHSYLRQLIPYTGAGFMPTPAERYILTCDED